MTGASHRGTDRDHGSSATRPPGVTSPQERIESFLASGRATWYNHVNIAAHPNGGHFIPWEVPEQWTTDLVQTFRQAGEVTALAAR